MCARRLEKWSYKTLFEMSFSFDQSNVAEVRVQNLQTDIPSPSLQIIISSLRVRTNLSIFFLKLKWTHEYE